MKYNYFKQQSKTDCLLTCVECLIQKSRNDIDSSLIDFYEGGYLSYKSCSDIIKSFYDSPTLTIKDEQFDHFYKNENMPMILGINFDKENRGALHAVFFDGMWIWEPHTGNFLKEDISELNINYVIFPKIPRNSRVYWLDSYCHEWDLDCRHAIKNNTVGTYQVEYLNVI